MEQGQKSQAAPGPGGPGAQNPLAGTYHPGCHPYAYYAQQAPRGSACTLGPRTEYLDSSAIVML